MDYPRYNQDLALQWMRLGMISNIGEIPLINWGSVAWGSKSILFATTNKGVVANSLRIGWTKMKQESAFNLPIL